jgi:general stress protein YciG
VRPTAHGNHVDEEFVMPIDEKQPDANESASGAPNTPAATALPTEQARRDPAAGAGTATEPGAAAPPRRRGFAAMDRDRVKQIASKGGRAAHAAGTAHQFNSDEARVAGKKGGMAPHVRRGGVRRRPTTSGVGPPIDPSRTREHGAPPSGRGDGT